MSELNELNQLNQLHQFRLYLQCEEKSTATVEKYLRDCRAFTVFRGERELTKELTAAWKQDLLARGLAASSINSMLAGLNCFLRFLGRADLQVKPLRIQRKVYCPESRQLTRGEYEGLLAAAEKTNPRLWLILQSICGTGIRISELQHFTAEAVRQGEVTVRCKGKTRLILLPAKLRKKLLAYMKAEGIEGGVLFRTRSGRPMDRSNIWRMMKAAARTAGVSLQKVFPHNLRKLFARTFYRKEKDIAKLADILGHGSIETTRIYIMTTGREHQKKIDSLGLVV